MFKRILRGSYRFLKHSQVVPGQIIFYTKDGKHYKIHATNILGNTFLGFGAFGRTPGESRYITDYVDRANAYFYEYDGKLHWSNIPPSVGDVVYVQGQRTMVVEHVTCDREDAYHRPPYYIVEDDYCHRHTFFGDWRRDIPQVFYPVLEYKV